MRISILTLVLTFLFQAILFAQISTDNVFVLPIRQIKSGQDIDDFIAKRDAYVALLEEQTGTLTDREFQPFFEFTGSGLPLDSVYVGLTSFTDFQKFQDIGAATSGQIANDFFATFDFITFQVLQPLDSTETVDLADFANLGTGQVWEVAVRDLSLYDDFDQADYESRRDAYLAVLAAQDNFVREVQWQSISDPNVVVGMTVYRDAQSYAAVNADSTFINEYLETGFLQNYPINVYGAIHNPLKGTLDPGCEDIGQAAFPEDVTTFNGFLYTSSYFDGSITQKNLTTGELVQFAPPATDVYNSAWGLRVDRVNNRLLSIANQFYDFNPANAQAGRVNAYDIATGNIVGTWDLPSGCVGNSIDIDNNGNYYVGDIGPDTRIIQINPNTNEVTTWADDSQWTDGGFGTGGMVWNQTNGFYVAQGGTLWYVPQNTDGTAGAAVAVNLTGTTAIDGSNIVNADGMTWAGSNTIFYAENDVFTPGWNGIVHRVELSDATNGTNTNFIEGLNDCSGVFFDNNTLYVNESQFGVPFGVNFVPTSNPFCVKAFSVMDVIESDCPIPSNPVTEFSGQTRLRLSWDEVAGANGYIIQLRLKGRDRWAITAFLNNNFARIWAIPNREFEYRIRTVCGDEQSEYSPIYEFETSGFAPLIAESRSAGSFQVDIDLRSFDTDVITLEVTPNPFINELYLYYTVITEDALLSIYHVSGQKVLEQTLSKDETVHLLELGALSEGVYMLSIQEQGLPILNRRIVKHNRN